MLFRSVATAPTVPKANDSGASQAANLPHPVVIPTPPPDGERAAIKAALYRYRQAYESEDLDEMKRAWPSMSRGDYSNLKHVFSQFNAIHLTLNCADDAISIQGDTAAAVCQESATYSMNGRTQPGGNANWRFTLKLRGGSWVVDSVR